MNTSRHNRIQTPFDPKAPGRPCCYCGKPRPAGRRRWCSQECVDDFLVRKGDAVAIERCLLARDHGICAGCGADMEKLRRVLFHVSRHTGWLSLTLIKRLLRISPHRTRLWDGDHIVPVIEGGGGSGLDNYRTLCIWCHKQETKHLAKRRAQHRQDAKRPLLAAMDV